MLDVITYPDPRLTRPAAPVEAFNDELRAFVRALEATMRGGPPSVGIAAPQVGRSQRIAIVDVSARSKVVNHGRLVLINPVIVTTEGSVVGREGCLSVPDYTGNVMRAARIEVVAFNEHGDKNTFSFDGFEARAVQYAIDHLEAGVLPEVEIFHTGDMANFNALVEKGLLRPPLCVTLFIE